MSRARRIGLALALGAALASGWALATPAAHACHTAAHCAQEEVVEPLLALAPQDAYACSLSGRSTTWSYVGGFPAWGDYRFEGEASCVRIDVDDGEETGPRLTGAFELAGEHSQLLGLPACTMFLDGLHVFPDEVGRIDLDGDDRSPLRFRHLTTVSGGQGYIDLREDRDPETDVVGGYGALSLVATDRFEDPPKPVDDPSCVTSSDNVPGFFIEAEIVAGVFPNDEEEGER